MEVHSDLPTKALFFFHHYFFFAAIFSSSLMLYESVRVYESVVVPVCVPVSFCSLAGFATGEGPASPSRNEFCWQSRHGRIHQGHSSHGCPTPRLRDRIHFHLPEHVGGRSRGRPPHPHDTWSAAGRGRGRVGTAVQHTPNRKHYGSKTKASGIN